MKVVAGEKYSFGFVLEEQEFRRIISLIREQFQKREREEVRLIEKYDLIYKNGTISQNVNLDSIFEEENYGSGKITNIIAKFRFKGDEIGEQNEEIKIEFNNLDEGPRSSVYPSISYDIIGLDRDWVFTTSSFLDERMLKLKTNNQFVNLINWFDLFAVGFCTLLPTVFLVIGLFSSVYLAVPSIYDYEVERPVEELSILPELEQLKESNSFETPVDAIIAIKIIEESKKTGLKQKVENWNIARNEWHEESLSRFGNEKFKRAKPILMWIFCFLCPFILLVYMKIFVKNNFCKYNFLWGDNIEVFNKNTKRINFIVNVVILGTIISFIGGILANLF